MTKKFVFIIILTISLLVGFFIGKISEQGKWQGKLSQSQKEINWWKSLLEPFYPPFPEEIRGVSGKITKIEDKTI